MSRDKIEKWDEVNGITAPDSVGFVELPGFFSGKNHLRSAEDSLEQNDNSLDGVINNLPEGQAGRNSPEEKPSEIGRAHV